MSKLAEFRQLEIHLAEQMKALEALKNDSGLQAEIEFEGKLRELLGAYGKSLRDVISILDPSYGGQRRGSVPVADKVSRKPRTVKVYKNPHSGEIVETKGGNHKLLKQWKAKWGSDEVESWLSE
jgi:hypothetical protein